MKEQNMQSQTDKLVIQFNEDGFTIWKDGYIVVDCPFERLEKEEQLRMVVLRLIHSIMIADTKEEK